MKFTAISAVIAAAGLVSAAPADLEKRVGSVQGFDISNYQGNVDFAAAYSSGARFVIIKVSGLTVPC